MSDSGSSGTNSDVDPCVASGPDGYYDQPLNIAAVFIILVASLLGTIAPLFFQRHPRYLRFPFAIIIGKHVGTGVLLALALIHLLGPAVQTLTDSCLPAAFSSDTSGYSYSPLFAMLSAILMHLIENSVLEYTIYSKQGGGSESHSHSHSHSHGHGGGGHGHGQGHGMSLQLTELRPKAVALSDSDSKECEDVLDGSDAVHKDDGNHSSYHGDAVAMKQAYQRSYDQHTKVAIMTNSIDTVPDSPLTSPTATTTPNSFSSFSALHNTHPQRHLRLRRRQCRLRPSKAPATPTASSSTAAPNVPSAPTSSSSASPHTAS